MQQALAKYKIGLGVIASFAFIIFIVVIVQAGATKQDNDSYKKASKASETLNNYVDNKGDIPVSLEAAGITDVPSTVTYRKASTTSYVFCIDYKTSSSGFSSTSLQMDLLTAAFGSGVGSSSFRNNTEESSLYLSPFHAKGKECHTVKPYFLYNYNSAGGSSSSLYNGFPNSSGSTSTGGSSSSDPAASCKYDYNQNSDAANKAYFDCLDKAYGTSSQ